MKNDATCIDHFNFQGLQSDLADFIGQIKPFGFAVKLYTNGSRPRVLAQLLEQQCLDYVAMDLKAPPDKYKQVSGGFAGSAAISESFISHYFSFFVSSCLCVRNSSASTEQ